MAILDSFRDKVLGATRTAVKASGEFIEVTKISMAIKSEEDRAKELMLEIGKIVFESYKEGRPLEAELSIKCDSIVETENKILELKDKIMEIKNIKTCEGCGAEVDVEGSFCHKCGKRV